MSSPSQPSKASEIPHQAPQRSRQDVKSRNDYPVPLAILITSMPFIITFLVIFFLRPSSQLPQQPKVSHTSSTTTTVILSFTAGIIVTLTSKQILRLLLTGKFRSSNNKKDDSTIYNLKHGILNIDVDKTRMWMNMGYWKGQNPPRDFERACRGLLREVLGAAGLCLDSTESGDAGGRYGESAGDDTATAAAAGIEPKNPQLPAVNIIDIGFGCGDQALALPDLCTLNSYIGLTIDKQQFAFAEQRLRRRGFLTAPTTSTTTPPPTTTRQIFHADAATPDLWTSDLKDAIATSCQPPTTDKPQQPQTWLLALDVLYHLTPSRLALFRHTYENLHASITAFDLLLPDPDPASRPPLTLSLSQSLLLRLISLATSTPYTNFLTPMQYRAQLVAAGYDESGIEIRDVSEYVFGPLAEFLGWQDGELGRMLGWGIGRFRVARWVFGWWGRRGVVRGCVVVARWGGGGRRK